jgi:sigma-B regulation protein RsbU (phosphoserine phosphatase)
VQNAIRSQSLKDVRFDRPDEVLTALNRAYPMEEHDGRFFTIWYGVYDRRERVMSYASAGHPPAILLDASGAESRLGCANLIAGVDADTVYELHQHAIPRGSRLFLLSDGVFEAETSGGHLLGLDGLVSLIRTAPVESALPRFVYDEIVRQHGSQALLDDFSLVQVNFP